MTRHTEVTLYHVRAQGSSKHTSLASFNFRPSNTFRYNFTRCSLAVQCCQLTRQFVSHQLLSKGVRLWALAAERCERGALLHPTAFAPCSERPIPMAHTLSISTITQQILTGRLYISLYCITTSCIGDTRLLDRHYSQPMGLDHLSP